MSISILSDESVLIRVEQRVLHFDAPTGAIHVRAPYEPAGIEGILLASYPMEDARSIRLYRRGSTYLDLVLHLRNGIVLSLGRPASEAEGGRTARIVAGLTGCMVETRLDAGTEPPRSSRSEGLEPVFAELIEDPDAAEPPSPEEFAPSMRSHLDDAYEAAETEVADGPDFTSHAALVELLAIASTRLPVATADMALPRDGGRRL